jgi:hypothetical protein
MILLLRTQERELWLVSQRKVKKKYKETYNEELSNRFSVVLRFVYDELGM